MSNPPRVVYLEDLEKPAVAATKENVVVTVSKPSTADGEVVEAEVKGDVKSTTSSPTIKKTATGATKRQMSLTDMMSSSSSSSSKVAKTDTPALNSIPFSMSEYKNGMIEEQAKLLELECETMGKSW